MVTGYLVIFWIFLPTRGETKHCFTDHNIGDADMVPDDIDTSTFTDEYVRELANLSGIAITDDEISEVANRFSSLISELEKLKELDLSDIKPIVIFPEDELV